MEDTPIVCYNQQINDDCERTILEAHKLAAEAESLYSKNVESFKLSVMLAAESLKRYPNEMAEKIIRRGLEILPTVEECYNCDALPYKLVKSPNNEWYCLIAYKPGSSMCKETILSIRSIDNNRIIYSITEKDILDAVFSPNNRYIALLCGNKLFSKNRCYVKIFDVYLKNEVGCIKYEENISHISFSPRGDFFAVISGNDLTMTLSGECSPHIWTIPDFQELNCSHKHERKINGLCFSNDGKYIITASNDHKVIIWNIHENIETACFFYDEAVKGIRSVLNGEYFLTYTNRKVYIYKFMGLEYCTSIDYNSSISNIAVSYNFEYIAISSYDKMLKIYKLNSRKPPLNISHDDNITNIKFSDDNRFICTKNGKKVLRYWNLMSGKEIKRIIHTEEINDYFLTKDGKHIITTDIKGDIKSWSLEEEYGYTDLKIKPQAKCIAINPGCQNVAVAYEYGTIEYYNIFNGKYLDVISVKGRIKYIDYSNTGQYMACIKENFKNYNTNSIMVIETSNGNIVKRIDIADKVNMICFNLTNNSLAAACGNAFSSFIKNLENSVLVFSLEDDKYIINNKHEKMVKYAAFNSSGSMLAAVSSDCCCRVYDLKSGKILNVFSYDFVPKFIGYCKNDSELIIGFENNSIYFVDSCKGNLKHRLLCNDSIDFLCESKDRKYIAGICRSNTEITKCTVRIWENDSYREIAHLYVEKEINNICFSPDSKYFAALCSDCTVRVWNKWRPNDLTDYLCNRIDSESINYETYTSSCI